MITPMDRFSWSLACALAALHQIIRALEGYQASGLYSLSGWLSAIAVPATIFFAIRAWVVR